MRFDIPPSREAVTRPTYLLAVDVGNSRVKAGMFTAGAADALPVCRRAVSAAVSQSLPWDVLREFVAGHGPVAGGVVAGANPAGVSRVLDDWPDDWPGPFRLSSRTELPLSVLVPAPDRVGIDRLLNAVAVNRVRDANRPAIVVDSGTATTVDLVDADGAFRGGAILPGFELAARSLNQYTALLPLLDLDDLAGTPPNGLGTDTRSALCSGLLWGHVGTVRELVARLSGAARELGSSMEPQLILTGGGGSVLRPEFPSARYEPYLPLQGLVIARESTGNPPPPIERIERP
jgi:type III pantothenate kinase